MSMNYLVHENSGPWNVQSMKCLVYEMSSLWNIRSMKCPVYEMSVYEMSYEMSMKRRQAHICSQLKFDINRKSNMINIHSHRKAGCVLQNSYFNHSYFDWSLKSGTHVFDSKETDIIFKTRIFIARMVDNLQHFEQFAETKG